MATRSPDKGATDRDRAKAQRQEALLTHAARLFAERGFAAVSIDDLGAAAGVSGPALYRHFPTKQALLGAILLRVSERLLAGADDVVCSIPQPDDRLAALVDFHVAFALRDADVIRVQDRDLSSLSDEDRRGVRRLQREYVELWVDVLAARHPARSREDLRLRAHAVFGLINSTPYSARALDAQPLHASAHGILAGMAAAALRA